MVIAPTKIILRLQFHFYLTPFPLPLPIHITNAHAKQPIFFCDSFYLKQKFRVVQTLDNIAMANSEYADIVISEGGKGAIEFLAKQHSKLAEDGDEGEELCDACSSALLSMEALQHSDAINNTVAGHSNVKRMVAINMSGLTNGETKSTSEAEDTREMEKLKEKITKFRNMLVGGKVVSLQGDRGGKKKMHILLTKDLQTFMFKSPMERGSVGHMIKIDDIRRVDFGSIVKKKTRAKPGQGRFFVECIQAVRSIDIITDTQAIADDWVEALDALVIASKKFRQLLPKM